MLNGVEIVSHISEYARRGEGSTVRCCVKTFETRTGGLAGGKLIGVAGAFLKLDDSTDLSRGS